MMNTWPAWFEETLRRNMRLLSPEQGLTPATTLSSLGADSLSLIRLLVDLEDECNVVLPDEAITPSTFATVSTLWSAVASATQA